MSALQLPVVCKAFCLRHVIVSKRLLFLKQSFLLVAFFFGLETVLHRKRTLQFEGGGGGKQNQNKHAAKRSMILESSNVEFGGNWT